MTDEELTEITKRAVQLLSGLVYGPPELIRATLAPRPEDFAAVFLGDAARLAAEAYAPFWEQPPGALTRSVNAQVRVVTRRSQDIVASDDFPGGYRKIAHLLAPDVAWCRFKLVGPGDAMAYDGLVSRGDRWAWFPKPWRLLPASANTDVN